jgi:TolA-binding protein
MKPMRFPNTMTYPKPFRLMPLSIVLAALALTATASPQKPAPSPSPSPMPAASPVVVVEPVVKVDDLDEADAAAIEAEVARAQAQAKREIEAVMRDGAATRAIIERGARDAAKAMAKAHGAGHASAEARLATERAMAEAFAASGAAATAMRESFQEAVAEQREKSQADRERERERQREAREKAREKAVEARERGREAAEAARESQRDEQERDEDAYEQAMELIDEEEWNEALRPLNKLVSQKTRLDAALYWTGYCYGKTNRTASALSTLARLQKEFPTSRWAKEAKALEMEVRGKSGQAPRPDQEDDLDLKLMAVSALAQSDPQEAMPMLAKILTSPSASRKVRERSLFVLAQMGTDQAGTAIAEVAKGKSSPELQRQAIKYLGVFGGSGNRKILSDVYTTTADPSLRREILKSFMVSGDKVFVLSAAKTEKDPALRTEAVRLLGVMGGSSELSQMYSGASSTDEKKAILHALFLSGAIEPMATAARGEKDREARLSAVRNLGLMGRKSETVLLEMYRSETDFEVKKEVLNAFFLQGNSIRLVEIARAEKDARLKKDAVHWLSLMNSKESRAFMLELLKD